MRAGCGSEVFLVGDVLHPGHGRTVQSLLDSDVGHGAGRRGAVPVLPVGRTPELVAGVELELRAAFDLGPANAFGDDQRLAERVLVPSGTCTRLKMDDGAPDPRWFGALELARDGDLAREIFRGTLDRFQLALSSDFHLVCSLVGRHASWVRLLLRYGGQDRRRQDKRCEQAHPVFSFPGRPRAGSTITRDRDT